ncbi:MAG: methyltransferase domain-containing protein [bacterium]
MIFRSPQNPNSHLTIKERKWPSYPTKQLFSRKLIKGKVLDFGCGLGVDYEFLRKNEVNVVGYDPHYKPDYPKQKFDTILCNYVLNILLPEEQAHVLMAVSELLNSDGRAYYAVRRDVKRSGFRYNSKHKCKTYQCNVILPFKSIILTEHCEIYEYQHINQLPASNKRKSCSLCHPSSQNELITESATAYALFDDSSFSNGHVTIVPKRHVRDYFELSFKEQCACWLMLNRIKELLNARLKPVGIQIRFYSNNGLSSASEHFSIFVIPEI